MDTTPGVQTSEHAAMQSASLWGKIASTLGMVITVASLIGSTFGATSKWGIVAGSVVTVAGQLQHLLATLGYVDSRTQVKVAASGDTADPKAAPAVQPAQS